MNMNAESLAEEQIMKIVTKSENLVKLVEALGDTLKAGVMFKECKDLYAANKHLDIALKLIKEHGLGQELQERCEKEF